MNYRLSVILSVLFFAGTSCFAAGTDLKCEVSSKKICYKPGEMAHFVVEVRNPDKAAFTGNVEFSLAGELDKLEYESKAALNIAAESNKTVEFEWKIPADRKWGNEIRACVKDSQGKIVCSDIEFFAIGQKAWQVGHWNTCCNTGCIKDLDDVKRRVIDVYRWKYCTAIDYFSWQPSCWETMAPQEDEWLSGQTALFERKAVLKRIISDAHDSGMNVFSYIQGTSWGPFGVEFIRSHPEWWNYDKQGNPFPQICSYSVGALDKMRKNERLTELPWCWFSTGVLWKDEMKLFMFDQLKKSVEMFNWDGFRSDGLPLPGNVYDREGKYHNVVGDDPIVAKIDFINELREWLHKNVSEDCQVQFNSGSVEYGAEQGDKRLFQAKARGSYALWESALYASMPGTDLNDMRRFAKFLHVEVQAAREVGGYRHVGWMAMLPELLEATATACGAMVDMNYGWDSYGNDRSAPMSRIFTFRFSRYFWDPDIRHIENSAKYVSVKAPARVWWKDFLQVRKDDSGKTFYMLHMINLPENYPTNRKAADACKDIYVVFKNVDPAKVRAFVLSPDFGPNKMSSELTIKKSSDSLSVRVPELKLWNVVVFEIDK